MDLKQKRVILKEKALALRKQGYSYFLIQEKTKVAKSTLNYWFKKVKYKPNKEVLFRISNASKKSRMILKKRRQEEKAEIEKLSRKEIKNLTRRDLWMIGIGLYIGEGSKHKSGIVRIVNSDPEVIKIAIKWFINSCSLSIDNLTIALHLYPDNDVNKCLDYWSSITEIPINQFRKTQVDKRKNKLRLNKNKLPYGTAHLTIRACGNKHNGVYLFRHILGWINEAKRQLNAGMVQW